jgi:hypothetical protein
VPAQYVAPDQLAALNYAFDTWGWDCIVSAVAQTPDKMLSMDFFMPTQHYTLAVVASRAEVPPISIGVTLGAWAQPFDKPIWALLGTLLVFSSLLMYGFERAAHSHDDFGPEYIHWTDRLGRGLYRATSNWTAVGGFTPVTPAGRVYTMTFAFVMLLMQSAYTANLAAFFTRQAVPTQRVSSIDAFATLGTPACVLSDPLHLGWLASNYANTQVTPIAGTASDVLEAVRTGRCMGGVAPDAALAYALSSSGDPGGQYCNYEVVQSGMGVNVYAIPLRRGAAWATQGALRAVNALFGVALAYGEYALVADVEFFDTRPLCRTAESLREQAVSALDALKPLGTRQLAGVLFVQSMGVGAAVMVWLAGNTEELRNWWDRLRGVPEGGMPNPNDPPEEDTEAAAALKAISSDGAGGEAASHLHAHHLPGDAAPVSRHKQISISAMMSIERNLEAAMKQFNHVAQTQRELDAAFLMQEHTPVHINHTSLAVVAKMDRAMAHGMRAVGEVVLYDEAGDELAALSYGLPTTDALAAAHAHMTERAAQDMEAVIVTFLRARVALRRNTTLTKRPSGSVPRSAISSGGRSQDSSVEAARSAPPRGKPAKGAAKGAAKKGGKIPAFQKS